MATSTMTSTQRAPAATMDSDQGAKLLLRVLLGVLVLFHGIAKLIAGPAFVVGMVTQNGLPAFLAYGVYIGEIVAPILLIIGLWTRLAAVVVVINMIFALYLAHTTQFFSMSKSGGYALELQAFFLFTAVAVAMLGAGRYSLGGVNGRWN